MIEPWSVITCLEDGETEEVKFVYTVADSDGGTNIATVTIVIDGVNDIFVADNLSETSRGSLITENIIDNDSDLDLDVFSVEKVNTMGNGISDTVASGSLSFDGKRISMVTLEE